MSCQAKPLLNIVFTPNPAQNEINIMIDATVANNNSVMMITDITGKTIMNTKVHLNAGMNAYRIDMSSYPTGTYLVTVANSNWKVSEKVSIQR